MTDYTLDDIGTVEYQIEQLLLANKYNRVINTFAEFKELKRLDDINKASFEEFKQHAGLTK